MTTREKAPTILTAEGARRLTARIRDALALADDLLVQAHEGQAWIALGYGSWGAYCEQELPQLRMIRLSKVAQTEHFTNLSDNGFSTRTIAAAFGVSQGTVRNRLAAVERPQKVMSQDGRLRPARNPRAPQAEPVSLRAWEVVAHFVAERGLTGATCLQLEDKLGWRHGAASGAFHAAERKGHVRRDGRFRNGYGVYVSAIA